MSSDDFISLEDYEAGIAEARNMARDGLELQLDQLMTRSSIRLQDQNNAGIHLIEYGYKRAIDEMFEYLKGTE